MWKERVTSVSDHIFPGLSNYNLNDYDAYVSKGNEVLSNLPLQVALYFNIIYFPVWLIVNFELLPVKCELLTALYRFILYLVLATVIVVEVVRLYMGYIGNLKEQIPEMAGFWLLTILLQTPLQLFLLACSGLYPTLLDSIMQFIMCLFLLLELVFGFIALRRSAKHSVQSFHLASFHTTPSPK
uniref:Transmembrane protein 17B n=1 Tax=Lygus hesperus TaxID=30085 RepID=A0A0A9WLI9_LYGHE